MIIRPFLYDVKRTITSKTVLILVAVILMVSLTIIPLSSIRSMGGFGFREAPVLYYRDNGGYHFLAYSTNSWRRDQWSTPKHYSFNGLLSNISASSLPNAGNELRWTSINQLQSVSRKLFCDS